MLRTIISLCTLLAALFFVFRGIQESTAKAEAPQHGTEAPSVPPSFQHLLLQRARQLHDSSERAQLKQIPAEDALQLALEEIEMGWKLIDLLTEQESLATRLESTRLETAPVEPNYANSVDLRQTTTPVTNTNSLRPSAVKISPLEDLIAADQQGVNAEKESDVLLDISSQSESEGSEPATNQPVANEPVVTEVASNDSSTQPKKNIEQTAPQPVKRELTRTEQILSNKINHVLNVYRPKMEMSSNDKNCWEFMHTLIGYGVDNYAWVGRNRFNTIGYLCWNGKCRGFQLFENENGQLKANQGYGVQGHHGQFLAMLAQHRVTSDYTIKAGDQDFTINDLIEFEKSTCEPKSELTFKLIALTHYLESDATWSNKHGQWSIPRLIQEELAQPVVGAACGGTHRLMGLSYAANYREKRHEPMTGEWKRAHDFVTAYQDYAFNLQNRNGSFSTKWFEGRADNGETQRYQETSGHITEWLAYSLPEERLHEPRMIYAVNFLANLMLENHDFDWKIGPRGHAIRALALYHERAFGEKASTQFAHQTQVTAKR